MEVAHVVPIAPCTTKMFRVSLLAFEPGYRETQNSGIKPTARLFAAFAMLPLDRVHIFVKGLEVLEFLRIVLIDTWVVIASILVVTFDSSFAPIWVHAGDGARLGGDSISNVLPNAFFDNAICPESK